MQVALSWIMDPKLDLPPAAWPFLSLSVLGGGEAQDPAHGIVGQTRGKSEETEESMEARQIGLAVKRIERDNVSKMGEHVEICAGITAAYPGCDTVMQAQILSPTGANGLAPLPRL